MTPPEAGEDSPLRCFPHPTPQGLEKGSVKQRDDVHEQYSQWLAQIFNGTAPSDPSTPANHALRHASTGVGVGAVRAVPSTQHPARRKKQLSSCNCGSNMTRTVKAPRLIG
ncbi:hypothetical protein FOYG_09471 [Fusarium oxysporum NRRL 32931]|uniref:Uncharacterized protein n=1 Tax=Fusarium oxysporum NRRL 32931 TaxID=660029 RepID=W9I0K9_FUSOX|nr:hypothetical protein FOYG_09471 [Fusarium oxysporum NRRL 32931]EWY88146.1 hypothetical protein FOYG_09471 [Fusarium oxysporum NRRL 32931]EWY88147.1 hypothetical protein FOYG_09471 [Fusarium oxysporum NRRL 32931]EWY88148.1 hypothetical protein FOYG_09471 [Fusarium oxysporum NRRL 32931]